MTKVLIWMYYSHAKLSCWSSAEFSGCSPCACWVCVKTSLACSCWDLRSAYLHLLSALSYFLMVRRNLMSFFPGSPSIFVGNAVCTIGWKEVSLTHMSQNWNELCGFGLAVISISIGVWSDRALERYFTWQWSKVPYQYALENTLSNQDQTFLFVQVKYDPLHLISWSPP